MPSRNLRGGDWTVGSLLSREQPKGYIFVKEIASSDPQSVNVLELYRYWLTVGLRDFKELPLMETKHTGQNIGGENLDLRI